MSRKKITVLGAGMVGRAMAIDLSKKHDVTSVDISKENLSLIDKKHKIKTVVADLSIEKNIVENIAQSDIVVSAVPGFMGMKTIKSIIEAGKNFVDISFLPEDVLPLQNIAKKKKVTGITDCGVAPGMPNFIIGYHNEKMTINNFEYMVGGLPKIRQFPFEYKAPFSPVDVIEEYTRPARFVSNGKMITAPAMSDPELINFEQVGTLEAFNTDGLRSIIFTMGHIPNMKEKTLRYPGHIGIIKAFQAAGFFSHQPVKINKQEVVPFDFTTKLLFDQWKLGNTEPEFTIMRVKLEGEIKGKTKTIVYDLYDEYCEDTKTSSMARTTGYTGTAGVELILNGLFTEHGVFPPELVGKNEKCFHFVLDYLAERNVKYVKREK